MGRLGEAGGNPHGGPLPLRPTGESAGALNPFGPSARVWGVRFPVCCPDWLIRIVTSSGVLIPVCRGVRGATTVDSDDRDEILKATRQLLALVIRLNGIESRDVGSAIFTTTPDLTAEFPALAARQLGWLNVALLCTHEISVPGSLPRCIRVLIHWNTTKPPEDIRHVYIREAQRLRPDHTDLPPVDWDELEGWIQQQLGRCAAE